MTTKETPSSSEGIDVASLIAHPLELGDSLEHFRIPGGYATELIAALSVLPDANAELHQLRDIPDDQLTDEQKAMKDWATETIGHCNQIVLEHAEQYPHLFKNGLSSRP